MSTLALEITERAAVHFAALIEQEDNLTAMNLRAYVVNPGTSRADVGITFCPPGDEQPTDVAMPCQGFTFFVAQDSLKALEGAKIDYKTDEMGGQLSIKAPNLKGKKLDPQAPLLEQVQYTIENEINPNLAGHGGAVHLVEIQEGVVTLRFSGGCQGCGMANVTLKQGIENSLKEKFPEIKDVIDVTAHEEGNHPYY